VEYRLKNRYISIPYLALEVSPEALAILEALPEVLAIEEDVPVKLIEPVTGSGAKGSDTGSASAGIDRPQLNGTVDIVDASDAWAMGYGGSGWYVAILDSGIRKSHDFFDGKTVVEACYAKGEDGVGPAGDCPNGLISMTGSGSAVHHPSTHSGWDHGTHVSGIAAGNDGSLYGVARDANIIAVQVFSKFADCSSAEGDQPCVMSWQSDQLAGLDYVYSIRGSYSIAAVNMSLGGGAYSSACDSDSRKTAIDNLRSVGIATAIATGNDGYCGYISAPSCISSAISVGSSTDADQESYFNNWHATMQELFAPGSSVYSSVGASDTSYGNKSGTSMATPHVTGAWAILKQAKPSGTVDELLAVLQSTGVGITSVCDDYTVAIPRIDIDDALTDLLPSITVIKPSAGKTHNPGKTMKIDWTTQNMSGDVKIRLRRSDGSQAYTVVEAISHDSSPYYYTIPVTVVLGRYFVRIKQGSIIRGDSGEFDIGTITVTAPTSGAYSAGDPVTIAWSTEAISGDVEIFMRKSDGSEKHVFQYGVPHDGSPRTYNIPCNISGGSYYFKVRQKNAGGKSPDLTVNAITNCISVKSPRGGDTYSTGGTIPIEWTTSGISGDVRIIMRRSDGSGLLVIEEAYPYDGSPYGFTVPATVTPGSYFIRLKQGNTVKGESQLFNVL
jgi:subtilisin family serine protease